MHFVRKRKGVPNTVAIIAIAAFGLVVAASTRAGDLRGGPRPVDATNRWAVASPAAEGMNGRLLGRSGPYVRAHLPYVTSLLVVRHGVIVFEHYYRSSQTKRADVESITKSVVSALVGIALERGQIGSVDQKLVDFLPSNDIIPSTDSRVRSITLRDLLTMRGGWTSDVRTGDFAYTNTDNWPRAIVNRPLDSDPGTHFEYDSGTAHLVSTVLSKATGRSAFDDARLELFGPIGIADASWGSDPQGVSTGGWGLELTARDLARLGYLYLHEGRWHGTQVVPSGWEQASTAVQVRPGLPGPPRWGYPPWTGFGYFWWRYPLGGAFMASGAGGQFLIVWPKLDLIVVTTATLQPRTWNLRRLVERFIVPAIIK
jgi:CubicO group peptidase (beta-lactamase class C family)